MIKDQENKDLGLSQGSGQILLELDLSKLNVLQCSLRVEDSFFIFECFQKDREQPSLMFTKEWSKEVKYVQIIDMKSKYNESPIHATDKKNELHFSN